MWVLQCYWGLLRTLPPFPRRVRRKKSPRLPTFRFCDLWELKLEPMQRAIAAIALVAVFALDLFAALVDPKVAWIISLALQVGSVVRPAGYRPLRRQPIPLPPSCLPRETWMPAALFRARQPGVFRAAGHRPAEAEGGRISRAAGLPMGCRPAGRVSKKVSLSSRRGAVAAVA